MSYQYTNNASSTLVSSITSGSPTITLSTGTGALFPILAGGNVFRGTLVDAATQTLREIVQVTNTSGDTFTITRGQEGTTARSYNAGDIFYLDVTAAQFADFFSKTYDSFPNQTGRLINIQLITSTQTYTPTSGTNSIIFYLVGGGGAGGGCPATPMNSMSAGSGGGGGGLVISRTTSGFSGQIVTIGSGGVAALGATGGNGGNSTFLGCTAFGGPGGPVGVVTSSANITAVGSVAMASGGNISNQAGRSGQAGVIFSSTSGAGGAGGGSAFGPDTPANVRNASAGDGSIGLGVGCGGSGGVNANGPFGALSARTGGNGNVGVCLIYEYA